MVCFSIDLIDIILGSQFGNESSESALTYAWPMPNKNFRIKLARVSFIFAFIVILLGAYTRLTDAGLSCPDWPNCYGYLTAPHTPSQLQTAAANYPQAPVNVKKAWTEMTHRYFAGFTGLLIMFFAFSILFSAKTKNKKMVFISISLLSLLGLQVLLGMLTVTEKLQPVIVLLHLLTGITLLSLLWWACLDLRPNHQFFVKKSRPKITPWLWLAFIIMIAQITLGGWVSTHYAGLACIDFPLCNGQLLPKIQWNNLDGDLISIHMLHRLGALCTSIYLMIIALFMLKRPAFRSITLMIFVLLISQVCLGILNIVLFRPVVIALSHHAVAILLLLTIIAALVKTSFSVDERYA
jgi:heme a synthase